MVEKAVDAGPLAATSFIHWIQCRGPGPSCPPVEISSRSTPQHGMLRAGPCTFTVGLPVLSMTIWMGMPWAVAGQHTKTVMHGGSQRLCGIRRTQNFWYMEDGLLRQERTRCSSTALARTHGRQRAVLRQVSDPAIWPCGIRAPK